MTLNYQVTFEDFLALQKDSFKRIRMHQAAYNIILTLLISIVFMSSFALIILLLPKSIYLFSEILYFLLAALISVLPVVLMRPVLAKFYDTVMILLYRILFSKDQRRSRNIKLYIHEDGIHLNSSNSQITKNLDITWESVKTISEDDNRFFLYYEKTEALILPKRPPSISHSEQILLQDYLKKYLNVNT